MSRSVVVRGSSGMHQAVSVGPHKLVADEPEQAGSNDEGPDPYEYLLTALGTCTNMTLRMYADRKRWPLREVRTVLSHAKSYAADREHCEQPGSMVDRIERRITILGELSEGQRTRLLQIADRCPSHRTLTVTFFKQSKEAAALGFNAYFTPLGFGRFIMPSLRNSWTSCYVASPDLRPGLDLCRVC